MPISDAQYTAWLRADNQRRVVLVEAEAFSAGAVVTRYMSTHGFVTTPSDTPASTGYDDIVLDVPWVRSQLAEAFRGRSLIGYGDIDIDNSSGVRDAWLTDAWDGRPVRLFLGDPAWPKADFRQVFSGTLEDIQARDSATLTLRMRDRQALLNVPACTTLIGGTDTNKDRRRPICYGECKNVAPMLIDAAARTYAVHDGQIHAVDAVYVNGSATGGYTANLTLGTITLTGALTGTITADVRGSKTGGTYVTTAADVMQRLVTERTALTSGDIDAASVSAMNTAISATVGLYVDNDTTTVLQALDTLLTGLGGFYTIDRAGKLSVGQFRAPAAPAVLTLDADDVEENSVQLVRRILPAKSVRLGYARFWSTSTSGAVTLTEAQRERLQTPHLVAKATNTLTGHLLAIDEDLQPTALLDATAANTEAARQATLYSTLRYVYRLAGFTAAQQVKLGDVVALNLGRFGLNNGTLARVVGLRESLTGGRIELEVFV
jgi:hypothetical protein